MKMKNSFLIPIMMLFIASSTAFARPPTANLSLSAGPRPSYPGPKRDLPIKSNAGPAKGEPDVNYGLDDWDYLEVGVHQNDVNNLFVAIGGINPIIKKVNTSEKIFVWSENLVLDQWGPDYPQFNSFQLEREHLYFAFAIVGDGAGGTVGFGDQSIKIDPTDDPTTLDFPDGEIAQRRHYVALLSECQLDNSEKSPLCPAYQLTPGEPVGFIIQNKVPTQPMTMKILLYSQDPEVGNPPPDEVIVPMNTESLLKLKTQVLPIKIKVFN